MYDPIRPVTPADRSVTPVELTRLTPLQREEEKQRRERERRRREKAAKPPEDRPDGPNSGIDVRV